MGWIDSLVLAFREGGVWMWAILLIQLVSIAIIAERVWTLFVKRKLNQALAIAPLEMLIRRGDLEHVSEVARQTDGPIGKVVQAGAQAALNYGGKDEIQGKMDEVLLSENSALDKRTGFLAMLGNVATLTGLLGTITGMIKSFAAVGEANPADKATLLAQGISEAMNATAYGLITAIPALILYAVLQNRSNQLAEDLNRAGLKVYNWLSYSYEPVQVKGSIRKTERQPEAQA